MASLLRPSSCSSALASASSASWAVAGPSRHAAAAAAAAVAVVPVGPPVRRLSSGPSPRRPPPPRRRPNPLQRDDDRSTYSPGDAAPFGDPSSYFSPDLDPDADADADVGVDVTPPRRPAYANTPRTHPPSSASAVPVPVPGADTTLLYRVPRLTRLPSLVFTLAMVREVARMAREAVAAEAGAGAGARAGERGEGTETGEATEREGEGKGRARRPEGLIRVDVQRDPLLKRPMPVGRFQFSSPSIAQRVLAMASSSGSGHASRGGGEARSVRVPLRIPGHGSPSSPSAAAAGQLLPVHRDHPHYDVQGHTDWRGTNLVLLPSTTAASAGAGKDQGQAGPGDTRGPHHLSRVGLRDVAPLLDLEMKLPAFLRRSTPDAASTATLTEEGWTRPGNEMEAPVEYFRVPVPQEETRVDSLDSAREGRTSVSEEEAAEGEVEGLTQWFEMTLEPALIPPLRTAHASQMVARDRERREGARADFKAWRGFRDVVAGQADEGELPELELPIRGRRA